MKKIEFRSLSLVLGVILLLSAIVGCDPVEPSGDPSLTTGESTAATVGTQATTASRTLPAGEITTEATTEATTAATTSQPYWDGDALCFRAALRLQDPATSAMLPLNFQIKDGKIYIGDSLYEKISVEEWFDSLDWSDVLYAATFYDRYNNNQENSELLQRIQESEPYFVLKQQGGDIRVAVYKFDTVYYFVSVHWFNENPYVRRIHYAILDQEVF